MAEARCRGISGTTVLLAFVFGVAAVPVLSQVPGALERFRPEKIRAHMTFLADDLLEGRGTGTPAFEVAATYVAAQFAAAGLQPAGTGGSYYQRVRFRKTKIISEQTRFVVTQSGAPQPLEWGLDFVAIGNTARAVVTIAAPIIFVGHGISAPEYGHDDYESSVRGAIVAFLPGVPPNLPQDRRDYYTSLKWRLAQEHGALATIELYTPDQDKAWAWGDRVLAAEDSSATWLEADGALPANSPLPRLLLSGAATSRLLAAGAQKFTNPSDIPRPLRVADAVVTLGARHEEVTSPHVLAVLPGGDPQRRNE